MSQICLLTPFAKIKFSRKFPDLQYTNGPLHENVIFNKYTQTPVLNVHVAVSNGSKGLCPYKYTIGQSHENVVFIKYAQNLL